MSERRLYVEPGSELGELAKTLSWLWCLAEPVSRPSPDCVRLAAEPQADGPVGIAGSIEIRGPESPATLPRIEAVADFSGTRVEGTWSLLDPRPGEEPRVVSSLGVHAMVSSGSLVLACARDLEWGTLRSFWALEAIRLYLEERWPGRLERLPAIGVVRLDDYPGTAQHQAEGRAKDDARQRRRLRRFASAYESQGAVLNMAVAAQALADREWVATDAVWPTAVEAIRAGVTGGAMAPVCHGLKHLDPALWESGEIEFREFGELERAEADSRIDTAMKWHRETLGAEPKTFVAPAWAYSGDSLRALSDRNLPAWTAPRLGPLIAGNEIRETLSSRMIGLSGVDLSPIARLAAVGVPPTIALHGGLFDPRVAEIRSPRNLPLLLRLLRRPDIIRLADLPGVNWISSGSYARELRAHAAANRSG